MERRKSRRKKVKVLLSHVKSRERAWDLNLVVEDALVEIEGPPGDISRGGMFIPVDVPELEEGEIVHLRFTLPERVDVFEAEARVVWKGEKEGRVKGFGIEFKKLTPEALRAIEEMIKDEQ